MSNFSIQSIVQETGISKESLRKWEERYGFPSPARNAAGDRVYSELDLKKLRLIRQLRDMHFPLPLLAKSSIQELETLQNGLNPCKLGQVDPVLESLVSKLQTSSISDFERSIDGLIKRLGVQKFVLEVCAPMTKLVGSYWQSGRLSVYQEHVYSHIIAKKLKSLDVNDDTKCSPRVLLTTAPEELHCLGLLMAEIFFKVAGCMCISLGANTPYSEIVAAVKSSKADIVALSFSSIRRPLQIRKELSELRLALPEYVQVWIGGDGAKHIQKTDERLKVLDLTDVKKEILSWRNAKNLPRK